MAAKTNDYKSESIFQRRVRNFKKIKRAYYSLIIIVSLYLLSFLAPLLVNNKALAVHYNGSTYFPAIGDLFWGSVPVQYHDASFFGQTEVFGQTAQGEANYRELKKQYTQENKGNWVVMPFYPYSPNEVLLGEVSQPPTKPDNKHWFGTDNRGRDVLARVVYGFQISITFALLLTFFSYLLGTIIGACLGYFGGKLDILGMRFIEVFAFVPVTFLIMILSSFMKPSIIKLVALLTIFGGWIGITYLIRGEYLREKSKEYTTAAIAMGASDFSIMFKHILPNALTPIITFAPFNIIGNITALLSLDFLGFGLRPPTPSWGELISQGMGEDISFWWLIVTPLVMMFFTLLTITFIGEGVRQAFDPREYARLQ
jgi:microcin C transport system permease protein